MNKELKFDVNDFPFGKNNRPHSVRGFMYTAADEPVTLENAEMHKSDKYNYVYSHVCFAFLNQDALCKQKHNRLVYKFPHTGEKKLDNAELENRRKWLQYCQENNAIPDYVTNEMVEIGKIVLDLNDMSPSYVYVILSAFRVMDENPDFCPVAVRLIEKYNIPFTPAWAIAASWVLGNSGHDALEMSNSWIAYGRKEVNINEMCLDLSKPLGFKFYLKNPKVYDPRQLFRLPTPEQTSALLIKSAGVYFNCARHMSATSQKVLEEYKLNRKFAGKTCAATDFLRPEAMEAFGAADEIKTIKGLLKFGQVVGFFKLKEKSM